MQIQDPTVTPVAEQVGSSLQQLSWIDTTAMVVIGVFFVLGLFKGAFWQVSRIVILVVAYFTATRLGPGLGETLHDWTAEPTAVEAGAADTCLYLAYVAVFLAVLVVLSLLALLFQGLLKRAGMSFFDRLGGGLLGVGTGAGVVLLLLGVLHMFFPDSRAAQAASDSHSLRFSRSALETLGEAVPDELRRVFALHPLNAPAPDEPGAGEEGGGPGGPGQAGNEPQPGAQPGKVAPPADRRGDGR